MTTRDQDERRRAEWARYRKLYADGYGDPCPRRAATRRYLQRWLEGHYVKTWLDVGSGAADYSDLAASHGIRLTRTDPGIEEGDDVPAHRLADHYGAASYDLVTSFDCLEHLLPDELDGCIGQIWETARVAAIVSVGAFRSSWRGHDDLHLTIATAGDWTTRIADAWGSATVECPYTDSTPFIRGAK
jgi:hypothetical protein